jgi:hypothetical protein
MPPSIHDNFLVSYEVRCKERTITLRTEYNYEDRPQEFTNVVFTGVQGYRFEDDAFGNIIYGLDEVPVEQILEEHHAQIAESYHMAGAPGPWAANLESAAAFLTAQGARDLSSLPRTGCLGGSSRGRFQSITPNQAFQRTRRKRRPAELRRWA